MMDADFFNLQCLVEESKPEYAFAIFSRYTGANQLAGVVFTRVYPPEARRRFALDELVPVFWLTTTNKDQYENPEFVINPADLELITFQVREFVSQVDRCSILLDGLEALITFSSFSSVIKFVFNLRDICAVHNALLLVSCDLSTLDSTEGALIRSALTPLKR